MNTAGRLYQARMWREFAIAWDGKGDKDWVKRVLRVSKAECMRRARANDYLARRLNRTALAQDVAAMGNNRIGKVVCILFRQFHFERSTSRFTSFRVLEGVFGLGRFRFFGDLRGNHF